MATKQRGIALIMALLLIFVLSMLSASFFSGVINENRLVKRFVNSTRALWLAEAGVAEAINNMPSNVSGSLYGDNNYSYSASTTLWPLSQNVYYQISSTGSVSVPSYGTISRSLTVITETTPVDPNHFQHAIRTTSDLVVKGSATINGPQEEFASLNFTDLFQHSKAEMESFATNPYVDPPVNVTPVEGITWVNISPGQEFRITSDTWRGGCGADGDCAATADNGAILVVEGDAQITGGTYYGIIYVIGKLRMSGNPVINGTILAESSTEIDTLLTGNVTINYDSSDITNALSPLQFVAPAVVSWKEN